MEFNASDVEVIETGLGQSRPGAWRRLRPVEQGEFARSKFVAAWRVDMPKEVHRHPLIDHVVVGIDATFPFTDPVVYAPQGIKKGSPHWPHIDSVGTVCVRRLRYSMPADTRILSTLQDVLIVLDMPEEERDAEHRRELLSYWSNRARSTKMPFLCVMNGTRSSRDVVYFGDANNGVLFAEDAMSLRRWMSRTGQKPPNVVSTTHLIWLDEPLLPERFPKNGGEVMALAAAHALDLHITPGRVLPVLLGCEIDGIPVYVCAEIEAMGTKEAAKGFRPSHPRPTDLVAKSCHARPAVLRSVVRADYAWVHGRGKNAEVELLRGKRVAVVGCGALGGFLARALAQSGVGSLLLMDLEVLSPSNVGRHVLGIEAVGYGKAVSLAKRLEAEFPHAVGFDALRGPIENASPEQWADLSSYDLVIAAGINLQGELALSHWREGLDDPPPLVWTWLEELAVVGHAVGIVDDATLAGSFDAEGGFGMRLTSDWPAGEGHALESGCGVAYQPYSASDMMGTINAAHRLSLDILLGIVPSTTVRSWLGDRAIAVSRAGTIDDAFDRSFSEITRDRQW